MKTMHWPPHFLACFFAPGEDAHDDRVDADERLREARAGHRDERRVEPRRDRLGHHRLAGAGSPVEDQAALALAAGALEDLAGLPERDDAPDLFLRLGLAADVVELHAPVGVARLEDLHLRHAHEQHRAQEDDEVREEEERQLERVDRAPAGCAPRSPACAQPAGTMPSHVTPTGFWWIWIR